MWEALSNGCRHVFMSDIGGVRAALNVQLTLKCAYDIMPSRKSQSTKAPKLLWELQLWKKKSLNVRGGWDCLLFSLGNIDYCRNHSLRLYEREINKKTFQIWLCLCALFSSFFLWAMMHTSWMQNAISSAFTALPKSLLYEIEKVGNTRPLFSVNF